MALNPDAIPTNEQVRETLFDRFYYPYKKQIWAGTALLFAVIVGYLAVREFRQRRLDDQWDRFDVAQGTGRVDQRTAFTDPDALRKGAEERLPLLRRLVQDYPDDPVTPYALNEVLSAQVEAGQYDEALATLADLRARFKDFTLTTQSIDGGAAGQARSMAERIEAKIRSEKEWAESTAYVHPEPKSTSLALIETTVGNLWIGFYDDQAPDHVARFIARAKAGGYNGTQVFDVRTAGTAEAPTPLLFRAGSDASRYDGPGAVRDPGKHDQNGAGDVQEAEDARFRIRHRRGVVTSVVTPAGESGSQFMVIGAASGVERYDGQNTPFAAVLDREGSLAVLDRICQAQTYFTNPATSKDPEVFRMRDHPFPPIWIRRVSVWRDEKLEAGHAWDTARAGSPEPEPWEATLPAPPLPSEFAPKAPESTEPKKDEEPKKDVEPKNDEGDK